MKKKHENLGNSELLAKGARNYNIINSGSTMYFRNSKNHETLVQNKKKNHETQVFSFAALFHFDWLFL